MQRLMLQKLHILHTCNHCITYTKTCMCSYVKSGTPVSNEFDGTMSRFNKTLFEACLMRKSLNLEYSYSCKNACVSNGPFLSSGTITSPERFAFDKIISAQQSAPWKTHLWDQVVAMIHQIS